MAAMRNVILSLLILGLGLSAGATLARADEGDDSSASSVAPASESAAAPASDAAAAPASDTAAAPATDADLKDLWADFNHYVRIYRHDLAHAAATALTGRITDDQQLLDLVESSEYNKDYDLTILRAQKVETLKELAEQLAKRIQEAKIARARQPERIMADIRKLAEGPRANALATERLRAAGQYAAPYLLRVLLDGDQTRLHPYVLAAMVSIGRPMVYPLAIALPHLEPVPMGQVAQVLAEIGYPRSLPYLKHVLEDPKTDPAASGIVAQAYKRLADALALPEQVSAAELYLTLGRNLYEEATRGELIGGYDPALKKGIVWQYQKEAGLVSLQVPGAVFGDVLAMRSAMTALELNRQMDQALSLWLEANLRRENRLPAGETDPSYSSTMQNPEFYILMAGPLRQHDVLAQALADRDTALALDAIKALSATAGTDALVNRDGAIQPLLTALSYPDRRVRFSAGIAMANARPDHEFPGSHRVVSVLAEAVRQTDLRYALVLAPTEPAVNRLTATVGELGYKPIGGTSIEQVADQLNAGPGVDLIIMQSPADAAANLYQQTAMHYKLAAVPVLALVNAGDQIALNQQFPNDRRFTPAMISEAPDALQGAVEQAAKSYAGEPISSGEAQRFAATALTYLKQIAALRSTLLNAMDAKPALIQCLTTDKRDDIVVQAAGVLAMLDAADAQQAIADAALDSARSTEMQIALLDSLAVSATTYGNRLSQSHLDAIVEMVKTGSGELANAAARAHGALTLPTGDLVQILVK